MVFIVILIIALIVYIKWSGIEYTLVLAGTHGNEPAPSIYLRCRTFGPAVVVVPEVNPEAIARGVRDVGVDMNRCWPDPLGRYCSPAKPLVDRASLVIDMHEAWGTEAEQPGSLGQTIYASDPRLHPRVDRAVAALNRTVPARLAWRRIDRLPALPDGTALDEYCVRQGIPYILVEMAGQNDIVPLKLRLTQCEIALANIL